MFNAKRWAFYISVLSVALIISGLGWVGIKLSPEKIKPLRAEHPGYFSQWLEEKRDANGQIPTFMRTKWQEWDRKQQNFGKRGISPIFDTIIELGPRAIGGRTRSLWIDPATDNHILACAISGGIWESNDKGKSWAPINDHETSLMASCITSNPYNHNILYYGTGESNGNSTQVDGEGVFMSANRGKSFTQLSSTVGLGGMNAIWDIAHSLDDSTTLFVGTHTHGLYRSQDRGQTWSIAYNGANKQVNDILVLPKGRILISMQSNGVYASDSSGNQGTWSTVTFPNRPASFRRIQLAACEKFPNVVYALFGGVGYEDPPVGFYKSSDGGKTWVERSIPSEIGASYQGYCVMLGSGKNDSNQVVAGGVYAMYSTDGGKNWNFLSVSQSHQDHHSFANFNQTPSEFITGSDGGIHRFKWGDYSIRENLNNGYRVTQFYAGGEGFKYLQAIAGAQDNGTHTASNRFVTQYIYGGDGGHCFVGQQTGKIAYLSTQLEDIYRVNNFNTANSSMEFIGNSAFSSDGVAFINAYIMSEYDEYLLFYRTNRGVYRSIDGGESWRKTNKVNRASIKALAVSSGDNPILYYGGGSAQLYKLESAANKIGTEVSFNASVPTPVTNDFLNFIEVNPSNPYQIFVAFSNYSLQGRIWKVSGLDSNSKPIWENISGNLPPGLPVNSIAVDPWSPEHYIFAATDFGLYYTLDGGQTWQKEMSIPNVAVHEVKIRLKDRALFAFTHGRGMWYLKLKNVKKENNQPVKPLLRLFPNPTEIGASVKIESNQPIQNYSIFTSNGQLIAEEQGNQQYDRIIKTENWKKGVYFVKVNAAHGTSTQKFIIR
jgi:hypothetical protein